MKGFRFEVLGAPQTKGSGKPFRRRRADGREVLGVRNDNAKTKGWESDIRWMLQSSWKRGLLAGAVWLELTFTLARPRSVSEKKRPLPTVKPDVDKLLRAVLDALTGIVYRDDTQVIGVDVRKCYGTAPGVEGVVRWEGQ